MAAIVVIGVGVAAMAALATRSPSPPPAPVVAKVERPTVTPVSTIHIPARNTPPDRPPITMPIDVTMELTIQRGNKPVVLGRTNLPSGARLVITLSQNQTVIAAPASVSDGQFRAGPFAQDGLPLRPGLYRVDVQSVPASQQPWPARDIFGANGHNLRGLNTRLSSDERRVSMSRTLIIGETQPSSTKAASTKPAKQTDACKNSCTTKRQKAKERDGVFDLNACNVRCVAAQSKRKNANQ